MKISLLHPSRGRPQKSFDTVHKWLYNRYTKWNDIEIVLSLDIDDPQLIEYFKVYRGDLNNLDTHDLKPGFTRLLYNKTDDSLKIRIIINNNKSVVEATNKAAEASEGNVLIYLSDDFNCPEDWDKLIVDELKWDNNRPLLLKVDDCLQKFNVPVLTIPIMNRSLYERLGYFWHPYYKSMHVDVDLYYTVQKLGALKNAEHLKFPHEHHSIGKANNDETYKRSEGNWDQGLKVFNIRKSQGFPI
jgi:hypothetical protein